MSTPDATPYVDLTLYDKDPEDIFQDGLQNMQTYFPEWVPREGATEVVLLESIALEVAQAVFSLNRMPGAILEALLRLYGVERDLGQPPVGTVEFHLVDDFGGHTIPAGTSMVLGDVPPGEDPVVLSTIDTVVSDVGSSTVQAQVVGERPTAAVNGRGPGTYLELLDAVVSVERVELLEPLAGGTGAEDDDAWFARGSNRFGRLTDTLVSPPHFVAAALEQPEVESATAIDNYDPGAGGAPGTHAGHITVAVYGDGAALTSAQMTALRELLESQALAALEVHVAAPTVSTVNVDVSVVLTPGAVAADAQAAVEAAVRAYLSPTEWEWSGTVYVNELISLIDQVPGVARVADLVSPAANVTLAGVAPLATAGAVTVTVV